MKCSFCERTNKEVEKMIAGTEANICDACVYLALEALQTNQSPKRSTILNTDQDEQHN